MKIYFDKLTYTKRGQMWMRKRKSRKVRNEREKNVAAT
jgi:hypothetical protein